MSATDKTLLEQMKITDLEIQLRRDLLGLETKDFTELGNYQSTIAANIDSIVDEFYTTQTQVDEIALLIGDSDTLNRLREAQRSYVLDLFGGDYGEEYVNNRLRIGMVHKRIGVEPKLYLSAIKTLKDILFRFIDSNKQCLNDPTLILSALDKLIYFDTTLVFDTYIASLVGEIENAKQRTEQYALSLEQKVAERTQQLEEQTRLDPLTSVYNHREFKRMLRSAIAQAKRNKQPITIIYIDIDRFKAINDEQGHFRGDQVLKTLGAALMQNIRESDTAFRYGGDEFCVILPDCDVEGAKRVRDQACDAFHQELPDVQLSCGIGCSCPPDYISDEKLIKVADANMYSVKKKSHLALIDKADTTTPNKSTARDS